LVLDGVAAKTASGGVRFHPLSGPGDKDVADVLATARRRILRFLRRRGLLDAADGFVAVDEMAEASPALAGISAASVMSAAALGSRARRRVRQFGYPADDDDEALESRSSPCTD
jgi:hypothetical protein